MCLFGDHQDYLGLPVIACAINKHITLHAIPNFKNEFNVQLPDLNEQRTIALSDSIENLSQRDYFGSGIRTFRKEGYSTLSGYNITIKGDIPINAGLSSSSACMTAWLLFLFRAFSDHQPNARQLAKLVHQAEVLEHDEPGGNMDQYTIAYGGLVRINTEEPIQVHRIETQIPGMIIANTGISKNTLDYLQRTKTKSQNAIKQFQRLRPHSKIEDVSMEDATEISAEFPSETLPYLMAAVQNKTITNKASELLQKEKTDWFEIGNLMNLHHEILRDKLKVSIPEIDHLVKVALSAGAIGAKIVGSGGGGCILTLAPNKEDIVMSDLKNAGATECFEAKIEKGAMALNPNNDQDIKIRSND